MSRWLVAGLGCAAVLLAGAGPPRAPAKMPPQTDPALLPLALAGDDKEGVADCAGRDVRVSGRRSAYVLRGGCRSVALQGDLLTVQAEMQPGAAITVTGRGSAVLWALLTRGRPPVATVKGAGSRVQRAESIAGQPVRRPAVSAVSVGVLPRRQ